MHRTQSYHQYSPSSLLPFIHRSRLRRTTSSTVTVGETPTTPSTSTSRARRKLVIEENITTMDSTITSMMMSGGGGGGGSGGGGTAAAAVAVGDDDHRDSVSSLKEIVHNRLSISGSVYEDDEQTQDNENINNDDVDKFTRTFDVLDHVLDHMHSSSSSTDSDNDENEEQDEEDQSIKDELNELPNRLHLITLSGISEDEEEDSTTPLPIRLDMPLRIASSSSSESNEQYFETSQRQKQLEFFERGRKDIRQKEERLKEQSFLFLQASLEVLESEEKQMSDVLDFWRTKCTEIPAFNEVIKMGFLKKQPKHAKFAGTWKSKFAVVAPGKMFVIDDSSSSSFFTTSTNQPTQAHVAAMHGSTLMQNGSSTKERCKIILLRPDDSRSGIVDGKKSGSDQAKFMFEVSTSSNDIVVGGDGANDSMNGALAASHLDVLNNGRLASKSVFEHEEIVEDRPPESSDSKKSFKRVWATTSEEERERWITALNLAMSPDLIPDIVFNSSHCKALKKKVEGSKDPEEYVGVLRQYIKHVGNVGFPVPVEYIQQTYGRARGEVSKGSGQMIKDLERDSCDINGTIVEADTCGCFCALSEEIIRKGSEIAIKVSYAKAMSSARKIFLACNRTESGGNILEALEALCKKDGISMIRPNSVTAAPLIIKVDTVTSQPSSSPVRRDGSDSSPMARPQDSDTSWKNLNYSPSKSSMIANKIVSSRQDISPGRSLEDLSSPAIPTLKRKAGHKSTTSEPLSAWVLQGLKRFRGTNVAQASTPVDKTISDANSSSLKDVTISPPNAGSANSFKKMNSTDSNSDQPNTTSCLRISVTSMLVYDILDADSPDIQFGEINAVYSRTFGFAGDAIVALGQGLISLRFAPSTTFDSDDHVLEDERLLQQASRTRRRNSLSALLAPSPTASPPQQPPVV